VRVAVRLALVVLALAIGSTASMGRVGAQSSEQTISVVVPEIAALSVELMAPTSIDPGAADVVAVVSVAGNAAARAVDVRIDGSEPLVVHDSNASITETGVVWRIDRIDPGTPRRLPLSMASATRQAQIEIHASAANADAVASSGLFENVSAVTMRTAAPMSVAPGWFIVMIAISIVAVATLGATGYGWAHRVTRVSN